MIKIAASTQRAYHFPGNTLSCFAYFSRYEQVFNYLPHISIDRIYDQNHYRLSYQTTEMGIYRVLIFCDILVQANEEKHILTIRPMVNGSPPVQSNAGLYHLTGQGLYSSTSTFHGDDSQTDIDFSLQLEATLPIPRGLKLMPDGLLSSIASDITQWRIREIADGFMHRSILAYRTDGEDTVRRN
jgi:hypothetical protein